MSHEFRELLKKIGSGTHTHQDLTRAEAATATRLILTGEATAAQIGAFLIAHRIKRPTAEELAGMLDAYEEYGPLLRKRDLPGPLIIFGHPYDGRSRTAPVAVLVALLLAAAGSAVLLHGSGLCPTKYGLPLEAIWRGLEVDWRGLSLDRIGQLLEQTGLGLLYLPDCFPQAQALMTYRDQIGKRPPLATLELVWSPYKGPFHLIAGYVHPPTEATMIQLFALRGIPAFTTVKGLEGSCDLPRDRAAILNHSGERLLLKARDYGLAGPEIPLGSLEDLLRQMRQVLAGEPCALTPAALWNGGSYLWLLGHAQSLEDGIQLAQDLLHSGQVMEKWRQLTHLAQPSYL
ncbi:MAG: anthranilate phosphoribosyltransferase family protein [Thermostichus sp. DG02_5_bins_236]